MTTRATYLTETEGMIFITSDRTVGIPLNNVIPTSMKSAECYTFTAFTAKDLLSCKHTCKCGGEGDEAFVCIHLLLLIFLLLLFLTEGLAQNILLEICARF